METNGFECKNMFRRLAFSRPAAVAELKGRDEYSDTIGQVCFYGFDDMVVISATLHNLPATQTGIFGFHIHENGVCEDDFLQRVDILVMAHIQSMLEICRRFFLLMGMAF